MSDARKRVLKLIEKKKRRLQEAKKFRGPHSIVCDFVKSIDDIVQNANSECAYSIALQDIANVLHRRMQQLDPGVSLKIIWAKDSGDHPLRVDAVEITWSSFYLGKNPLESPTRSIDVGQLFLEGYFDEI